MFFVMGDLLVCFWFYDVGEFWEGFDIGLDMDFLDIEWFGDLVFFVVGRKQMVRFIDFGELWFVVYFDEVEVFYVIGVVGDVVVLVVGYVGIYQFIDQG